MLASPTMTPAPSTIVTACLLTRSKGSKPPWRNVWLVAEYRRNRPTTDSTPAMPIRTQSTRRIGRRSCANVRLATRSMSTIRRDAARAARVTDLRIEAVDHLAGDRGRGLPAEATLFDHRHDHIVGLVGVGTNHRGEPRRVLLVRPLGGPGLARGGDLGYREALETPGGWAALHNAAGGTPES